MATLTPSSEDVRIYEICVLLPYPMQQKEFSDVQNEIESLFEEHGGKQIAKDNWGRRGLAYAIEGHKEGAFIVYYYELKPEKLEEVEDALRIMQKVLRHMVVKPPKGYEILEYSKKFEEWKQSEQTQVEARKKAREEELRRKMLEKQKRQSDKPSKKKAQDDADRDDEKITEEIDKLIADDELEL